MMMNEVVDIAISISEGTVCVMDEALQEEMLRIARNVANRKVNEIEVDGRPYSDVHADIEESARSESVAVLRARRSVPPRLGHLMYVFNKGDGLITSAGHTDFNVPKEFVLVALLTREAWRSLPPDTRDRIAQVTMSGGHWFKRIDDRRPLMALESQRHTRRRDPLSALLGAGSTKERHEIFLDAFPPRRSSDFTGYDEPIEALCRDIEAAGDEELQADLVSIMAKQEDVCLSARLLSRDWPAREDTLSALARQVETTTHFAGQGQRFWDLVKELLDRGQPQVRAFVSNLLRRKPTAEHALFVLKEARPWKEIVADVSAAIEQTDDIAVKGLGYDVLEKAAALGLCEPVGEKRSKLMHDILTEALGRPRED